MKKVVCINHYIVSLFWFHVSKEVFKVSAKKRNLSNKSRKFKERLLSSSKAKNSFSRTKNIDQLVVDEDAFMAFHPDGWQANPEFDEHDQKSHEFMVPCADLNYDNLAFSNVNTR